MKYFVISKCRLVDKNMYLMPDTIFSPDSSEYERTSRSLVAAIKAGWVRKATDEDIKKYEAMNPPKVVNKVSVIEKSVKKDATVGSAEFKPEDMADEVISGDAILQARDKRRNESTASIPAPQVDVVSEDNEEVESNEVESQENVDETSDTISEASAEKTETATDIKKEIEKRTIKKLPRQRKKS